VPQEWRRIWYEANFLSLIHSIIVHSIVHKKIIYVFTQILSLRKNQFVSYDSAVDTFILQFTHFHARKTAAGWHSISACTCNKVNQSQRRFLERKISTFWIIFILMQVYIVLVFRTSKYSICRFHEKCSTIKVMRTLSWIWKIFRHSSSWTRPFLCAPHMTVQVWKTRSKYMYTNSCFLVT
jgi:hypothetical protein